MSESEYMDICEQLSRDLAKAQAWNKSLSTAYDALWKEKELLLSVLKDWQEFAADVRAGDVAGQDWLDELKARTARIVDPWTI